MQSSGTGVGDPAGPCDPDLELVDQASMAAEDGGHIAPVVELLFENVGFDGQIMEVDSQRAVDLPVTALIWQEESVAGHECGCVPPNGWGLRRNEVRHLQLVDFSRNARAPFFGEWAWSGCATARPCAGRRPNSAPC